MTHRAWMLLTILAGAAGSASAGGQDCKGPPARNEADFVIQADGAQLQDRKTGLIWSRCIEGQAWNGSTCAADDPAAVNPGPGLSYRQARKLAESRRTPDEAWRLPTKTELISLREPNCYNPSLNLRLFPTQPAWSSDGWFWTSTPEAQGVSVVSAIGSSDAWSSTDDAKSAHVRLVRTPVRKPQ